MKKVTYVLFIIFVLAFSSCDKSNIFENVDDDSNNIEFTFTLATEAANNDEWQNRSDSALVPQRWIMEVWDANGENKVNCFGVNLDSHRSENSYGEFAVMLDSTKIYTCLFWADNGTPKVGSISGSNITYNADNLKAITLAAEISTHTEDAYFANILLNNSKVSQSIELKRAVAKVRLVEIGIDKPTQDITVKYSAYNAFNIATRSVEGAANTSFSHTFLKSEFEIDGAEKKLGSFLVFASDSDAGISIDFVVEKSVMGLIRTINGVKLYSNKITDIKENFFKDGGFINSISVIPHPDNVLRVDINMEFDRAVSYYIEYWKSDDEKFNETTTSKESGGSTTETLILLEPETNYMFKVVAYSGLDSIESNIHAFKTDALPADLLCSMAMEENKLDRELSGYILQTKNISPSYITMFNMKGVMVWYQDMGGDVGVANFDAKTKTISCICPRQYTDPFVRNQEIVIIDLMGRTVFRKAFTDLYAHHDVRQMPDGNIIVVNLVPRAFDLTEHGGKVDDFVWGDGYTIMDMQGNIIKKWDCFGELNPLDDPTINDFKNDWLHANSVNFDSEGNIYMSFNWTSELWKIDKESGKVLYRIGKNGNFDISPNGYTSGIHALIPLEPNKILLLDNGSMNSISRALIYSIDEKTESVEITLDVPLPIIYHTQFMGNVEIIDNNLLMFNSTLGRAVIFTDYKGNVVRVLKQQGIYNAYRSLYIPEIKS